MEGHCDLCVSTSSIHSSIWPGQYQQWLQPQCALVDRDYLIDSPLWWGKGKSGFPSSPLNTSSHVFWQNHLLSSLASVPLLSKVLARMEQGKDFQYYCANTLEWMASWCVLTSTHRLMMRWMVWLWWTLRSTIENLGKYMGRACSRLPRQHARRWFRPLCTYTLK